MIENIDSLLIEFKENRDALKEMIKEIETFKKKLDLVFPEKFDNRYKIFFEEKIKIITSFFTALLDIRKEINKSLKDEVDMRRRAGQDEKSVEMELDIHELASKVDLIKKGEYLNG